LFLVLEKFLKFLLKRFLPDEKIDVRKDLRLMLKNACKRVL